MARRAQGDHFRVRLQRARRSGLVPVAAVVGAVDAGAAVVAVVAVCDAAVGAIPGAFGALIIRSDVLFVAGAVVTWLLDVLSMPYF